MSILDSVQGQLFSVDKNGNSRPLHSETSGSVVLIDRTQNTQGSSGTSTIPSDVDTLQKLANKLGSLGFKSKIGYNDIEQGAIAVGGRNLLPYTSKDIIYNGVYKREDGYCDVITATTIDIPTEKEYIFSFEAKADSPIEISAFFFDPDTTLSAVTSLGNTASGWIDGNITLPITTSWKRYWVKWIQSVPDAPKKVTIRHFSSTNKVSVRALKLEEGNIATSWSPAPEDMEFGVRNLIPFASLSTRISTMESGSYTTEKLTINNVADDRASAIICSKTFTPGTYTFDYDWNSTMAKRMLINIPIAGVIENEYYSTYGYSYFIDFYSVKGVTFTADTEFKIGIGLTKSPDSTSITIQNLKMERGPVNTDWSPAPEDEYDMFLTPDVLGTTVPVLDETGSLPVEVLPSVVPVLDVSTGALPPEVLPEIDASAVGAVPADRKINGYTLENDITLSKSDIKLGNVTNDAQVKRSEMGVANGVATLDDAGKVPSAQLPSYVDDVIEANGKSKFPTTGESGKIYVDTSNGKTYRWGGSTYVEISESLALGNTASTAAPGNHGHNDATTSTSGFLSADDKKKIDGLATVATTGSYKDLKDKPESTTEYVHPSTHPASMITGLANVATSGKYSDLSELPTIPTITSASTSAAGIVQLNNTVTSSSTTQAATANAVKTAYDRADIANSTAVSAGNDAAAAASAASAAQTTANSAATTANAAMPKSGGAFTGPISATQIIITSVDSTTVEEGTYKVRNAAIVSGEPTNMTNGTIAFVYS